MRRDRAIAAALVAVLDGTVVGHVVLSIMERPPATLGLAPLAVAPAHQRRGIGRLLVEAALDRARAGGWLGVFVLGDPLYYASFGFSAAAARDFASPYAGPCFQYLALDPAAPRSGEATYAAAFAAL